MPQDIFDKIGGDDVFDRIATSLPATRDEAGNIGRRIGGGMKIMFPEFENFSENPGEIAAAIERGSGSLYNRIVQAVREDVKRFAEPEDIYFGPADNALRTRVYDAMRERTR